MSSGLTAAENQDALYDELREEAVEQCQVDMEKIEQVFPCMPLQEGLVAISQTQPGSYMARFILGQEVDGYCRI
ncbi:hypothetical protein MCOR11_011805 [Pyricularia oryzae]|nr:hypothetical protein MCOR11_011805 [Pyricularia oryzae]KAI6529078.1 hypothetical protein MCOR05_008190 [Pyricularia oryzae]